jgi:uncharacterized protein YkwD
MKTARVAITLLVVISLAVAAFVSILVVGHPQASGQTPPLSKDEEALLALINDYRSQNGLWPVKVSPALSAAASWMSEDMAENNYVGHVDSEGRDKDKRTAYFGYTPANCLGEIIAAGPDTPQGAFDNWRNSPAHNAVILEGFGVVGVGMAYNPQSDFKWYWTVDFGGYHDSLEVPPTPAPTPARIVGCPTAGKWSLAVWTGADDTPTGDALLTCAPVTVQAAYWLHPETQVWTRYLAGHPEFSSLPTLNNLQSILVLGRESP